MLELRELSRSAEELTGERVRRRNRLRDQLWRYYPQILALSDDVAENWIMDLWEAAPTPEPGRRRRRSRIEKLLQSNRIRRISAEKVREVLARPVLAVTPGTAQAAASAIRITLARLRGYRAAPVRKSMPPSTNCWRGSGQDPEAGGQRDAEILRSIPGVGRTVLATLLSEAHDPIRRWDLPARRALCGSAPVTKRSGKGIIVVRRMAVHNRLRNACHYMAVLAIQHDPRSRLCYDALRQRGCGHSRALRTVTDRLLAMACAMGPCTICCTPPVKTR